ncbi:hypothetical protein PV783_24835 [Chitinophaga sp. CC14]|uniref:hypothetical protein n=1 Tax=Chitinophaga sp. CC14 TaxID=3029199 RepID=UPI003B771A3C
MKSVKLVLVAAAAFVGLSSAIASTSRVVFTYGQKPNGEYFKLTQPFDATKCIGPLTNKCAYTVGVDLGATTTIATLTAAGAHQISALNRIYTGL